MKCPECNNKLFQIMVEDKHESRLRCVICNDLYIKDHKTGELRQDNSYWLETGD